MKYFKDTLFGWLKIARRKLSKIIKKSILESFSEAAQLIAAVYKNYTLFR